MDSEVGVGDSLTEGRPRGSDLNRAILDSLSGHVFAFDRECRVIFTDERACEALALAPAQVEGKHWADLGMPGEFMLPVEQEIIEVIETGLPIVNSSAHSILEAGLPVGYVVSPMFRRDGSVEGAVLHIRNSDGGPEVVEGYAASGPRTPGARAMHRIILDSVCDRIYAFDRDCRYTFAGEYACRFMGLKLSDLVGKHWSELDVPEQPMRSIERELREVMQTGLPIANSCQYMWQSRSMNIEYTVSPILAGKSHVEGAVVLVREIVSADDRAGELRAYQRAKAIQENDLSDHLASAAGSKALDDWVLQRRLRREATRLH
ncbi:MAG: PAS domain-containing protein, partial [Armatimonadetes bacterium]|nr:PAS domain-containing protein [Armatimonadota bacterium]